MGIFFSDWKCNLLALLILIISFVYVFLKRTFSYWDRKGFKTAPGCGSLFGHIESVLFGRESWSDLSLRLYKSTNDRFIGIYSGFRPALLIRDRELIKTILIKEFNTFPNRPLYNNPENDPISDHLLTSVDERWKNMRRILTPAFTGSKLREMFPIFVDCSSLIQKHLSKVTERGTQLNINELAAQYTISVIASVGFGLDVDAIDNADNHFFVMGRKIFEKTIWNGIRWMCIFLAPNLMPILRIRATAADVEEFFRSIAHQNLIHRERRNVIRKDVFQLLVQWRNEGMIHSDNRWNVQMKNGEHEKELTEAQVTAQMFIFFAAGYETSASAITFLMYELAKNAEIQQKLHDEIDEFIGEKNINEITFDLIRKLPYLDACSKEILRKYPIAPSIPRKCNQRYQIPDTDQFIDKGTIVYIPIFALQRDDQYYEEPNKFDPDRFMYRDSNNLNDQLPYMPFGDGPRNCIGMRLAHIQVKLGILAMLKEFRFELSDHDKLNELKLSSTSILMAPKKDIQLHVFKRSI